MDAALSKGGGYLEEEYRNGKMNDFVKF